MSLKPILIFFILSFFILKNIHGQGDCREIKQQIVSIKKFITDIKIPDSLKTNQTREFFLIEFFIEKNIVSKIKILKDSIGVLSQFYEASLLPNIGKKITSTTHISKIYIPVYGFISDNIINLNEDNLMCLKKKYPHLECSNQIAFSELVFKYDFTLKYINERKKRGHTPM